MVYWWFCWAFCDYVIESILFMMGLWFLFVSIICIVEV